VSGDPPPVRMRAATTRTAAAIPSAEAARLESALRDGLRAAMPDGRALRIASLEIRLPAGASRAEIAAAVRRAVAAAGAGRRR
jgi:type IV pilus biogenesis protein CpaD/CtpE